MGVSVRRKEGTHGIDSDAPVDLYIAAYADQDAARGDWDAIKQLANDDVIKVDGLVLVSRGDDGTDQRRRRLPRGPQGRQVGRGRRRGRRS